MTPPDNSPGDPPKPFLQHLEELRRVLIGSLVSLLAGMCAALPLAPRIFRLLQIPLEKATGKAEPFLRTLEVTGGISLAMSLVFWTGLLFSLPAIVYFLSTFIAPGLTGRERRLIGWALAVAAGLFIFGVLLGYFISLPIALTVMLQVNSWLGLRAEWVVSSYVVFALQMLAAFGIVFELPVAVVLLGHLRIITSTQLRTQRRLMIVLIMILAAVMTPPDVFSQLIMGIPLIVLYEICILLIAVLEKRRQL